MARVDRDTELSLVAGLRRGEPGAFDVVYEAYRARVFGFLVRLSRSRTVAEDLLDDTWLRLVSNAARLHADTRLLPWLFTVARNLYWTHRRSSVLEETMDPRALELWPCRDGWPSPFRCCGSARVAAPTRARAGPTLAATPRRAPAGRR
jgi:RNA polymerase sigma-70 factor (ECF subfamily)